jgi:ferredoxin
VLSVWIDQDLCTGIGTCVDRCPTLFELGRDGLAYVRTADGLRAEGLVDAGYADELVEAVEDCPQECIFVEAVESSEAAV